MQEVSPQMLSEFFFAIGGGPFLEWDSMPGAQNNKLKMSKHLHKF